MKSLIELSVFNPCRQLLACACLSVALSSPFITKAEEPVASANQLPYLKPQKLHNVMDSFDIRDGFAMDLVAGEPLVVDPVAMDFDAHGRAFVVEMVGYSEHRPERLGRIRLLEDRNDDGVFDSSQIYAQGLAWPTAVTCYDGGVFVGATPEILYFKDTDGDDVADLRRLVFTGFAADSAPYRVDQLNMQAMLNSFHWGPDNRIHGATGPAGGRVFSPMRPDLSPVNLRGRDFSFDPKTFEIRAESGGAQNGLSFDHAWRKFVCSNSDHIQYVVYDQEFAGRNQFMSPRSARISIAEDGPAAPVFRISPDEPWRVIRTRWRVAGAVRGPIEGGGTPSGYFTGATGVTLYTGDAWGKPFLGNAFIADCGSNLIHRKEIRVHGAVLSAQRPLEEQGIEFVRSSDNWFRPVQFTNGPDGNLYVLDMYREIIEHPWSLPQGIKQFLDLNRGNDRGRIYRLRRRASGASSRTLPGDVDAHGWVSMLGHSNGWHRRTASRLICQDGDLDLNHGLQAARVDRDNPFARMHAYQALLGLGLCRLEDIKAGLQDTSPMVRRSVLAHLGRMDAGYMSREDLAATLPPLVEDDATRFLAVLVMSKHAMKPVEQAKSLWKSMVMERDEKSWMQFAVMNAMEECLPEFLDHLVDIDDVNGYPLDNPGVFYDMVGHSAEKSAIMKAFKSLNRQNISEWRLVALQNLGKGLRRGGLSWDIIPAEEKGKAWLDHLEWLKTDWKTQPAKARKVIALLGQSVSPLMKKQWMTWLASPQWMPLHPDLVGAVASSLTVDDLELVWERWEGWSPATRQVALGILLDRPEWAKAYLAASRERKILLGSLSISQQRRLRAHQDAGIRALALALLDVPRRREPSELERAFQGSLLMAGNLENGQRLFQSRCASCHRANDEGHGLGPDLISVKSSGKNRILDSILFPNREVQPNYMQYEVILKEGESFSGMLGAETPDAMRLLQAGGIALTLQHKDVQSVRGNGISLMPEGLAADMNQQDMADLLEFIVRLQK
ncbi:MAG: c-type cytochrome [Verrucomicrobiota bacterium]|nr:c-type cytochrome [Verrucomicrobiota bacterium]